NNGDYTFTHNPSNNPDRFVLHFNKSAVSTTEREADKVNVWVYNGVLYIKGFENLVMPLLPKRNLINFEMCLIKS
ncbi:MAG: hypothetical protein ACK4EX_02505, partial [Thermaurantimonas sp.]|uniref:hypothetical protein n=1 Tax=Thermaurantimonas sp. TaxID=2681568 RepID=UPI00391CC0BC